MPASRLRRLAVVLLVVVTAGCGRDPRSGQVWREAGFVRHLAAGTEACFSLQGRAAWGPGWAEAWQPLLADPAWRTSWFQTPAGRIVESFLAAPEAAPLAAALLASSGDEVCVALGPGTAAQLAALQQVKRLFEAARIRNLFTPMPVSDLVPPEAATPAEEWPADLADAAFTEVMIPLPPAMQDALENFVRTAAIPPALIAFKASGDDPPLAAFLEKWVAGLPAAIARDRLEVPGHGPFTQLRLPVMSVVPRAAAVRARDILAANIGDPYAATYIIRDLLAKTTTLSFGRAHGYFVVSIGSDDPLAGLTAEFAGSLPAQGALDRVAPLLGRDNAALLYADPLVVSLAAAPPPVGEYLDAALESALEFAPAGRIRSLRETAAPLRVMAAELFEPRIAALSGVVRTTDHGWTAHLFGGSFAPRLALENATPLLAADRESAFLWTERWEENYAGRLLAFTAGVAAFADDWLEALGPVFLDDAARDRTGRLVGILAATAAPFRGEAVGLLEKAFHRDVALAVGLDGIMPPPPFAPAAGAQAVLPRLAVGAGLRDRQALSELREKITTGADLAWAVPSETTTKDGLVTYAYAVPLAGPDLAPAVTLGHGRWILGTSPSFTTGVADLSRPARGDSSVQSIKAATAPFAAFATAWAAALEEDGNLSSLTAGFIPSDPATLRAAARLLQAPRHFHYEARWEKDILHRVITLQATP